MKATILFIYLFILLGVLNYYFYECFVCVCVCVCVCGVSVCRKG